MTLACGCSSAFPPGNLAGVDHFLHDGMVHCELFKVLTVETVHTGVTDIENEPHGFTRHVAEGDTGHRRAPARIGHPEASTPNTHRKPKGEFQIGRANGGFTTVLREPRDNDTAGKITGRVTTHPISNGKNRWTRNETVLICVAMVASL